MSRTPVHHLPISIPEVQQRMSRAQLNSDPLRQSRDLLDKIRRARSGDTDIAPSPLLGPIPLLPDRDYVDTDQLRSAVFDVIKKRLRNRSVDTSQLSEAVISWSLPKSYLQQETWKLLLNHPLQTPVDLVNTALSLRPATPDTKLGFEVSKVELTLDRLVNEFTPEELMAALLDPKPSKTAKASDVCSFYIRSFRIQVKHLHQVLDRLVADGFGSIEQVKSWLAALEDIPMLRYVVIRYCGQTRNRSWDRHVQDIYSSTDTRFIVRFFRRIGSQCPDVLARAVVQTISPITSTLKLSPKEADMHERVLIALFGDGTLNLEVGGKDNMALTEADHSAFLNLGPTNLVADGKGLLLTSLHPHSQVTKDVLEYAISVRKYVDENSTTTGRHQFDDQTQATIIKQATANMLSCPSGTTAVLVTVGSDLGDLEDNRIVPFFEGNSRSSIAIQDCFNQFALWEQPLGATFKPNTVRQLARAHSLPFVDLFAWFERSAEDYLAARKLLDQYLTAVKPLIILTLGEMQTFAMTTPVDTFSKQAFHNSRRSVQAVEENLGVPILGAYNGTENNNEAIIVPCFHPSYLSHIGILKSKAQGLLAMVLAIAWHASYLAIKISITQPTLNRRQVCERVVAILNTKLQSNHVFGRAFLAAKRTFIGARDAYWSGRRLRGKAVTLPPVPTGILPTVIEHIRKGRVAAGNTLAGGIGGFEVLFRSVEVLDCPKQDNLRVSLRWKDTSDGEDWEIGPILLPADVAPKSKKDNAKRFVYFVQNGLDIRNTAGESLGGRKPVSSGKVRTETLPISSVILSMSESDNLNIFLHHWQEVVDVNLSDAWKGPDNAPQTDKFFSALFFKRSPTKRALPFTMKSLKPDTYQYYLDDLRTKLPANTGDMLWLVDRFLAETFPAGGELDLAAGSEVGTSVYHAIASFCSQQRYKNHPHLRTMLALTNIVEQGSDERMIATNALVYACQLLREPFEKKSKTLKFKVAGEVKQTKRFVLIVGSKTPKDAVCDWTEELESDALIISDDYSDDEGEAKAPTQSRRRRRSSAAREEGEQEEDDGDDTAAPHPRKLMRYNTIGGRKDR